MGGDLTDQEAHNKEFPHLFVMVEISEDTHLEREKEKGMNGDHDIE